MIISVIRRWFSERSTEGELWVDGARMGFTLEPAKREGDVKPRAIPALTYEAVLNFSPHFNRMMPWLLDVPGFEAVRIHPLNYPSETEGCIGVGLRRGKDELAISQALFEPLLRQIREALERDELVFVVITEEPEMQVQDPEISV